MSEKTSNSIKSEDATHENLQINKSLIHKTVEAPYIYSTNKKRGLFPMLFFAQPTLAVGAIFKSRIVVGLGFAIQR
jgi:hypothetical protein